MRIEDFYLKIDAAFSHILPDELDGKLDIRKVEVLKINDQIYHGYTFRFVDKEIAPTFYIDDAYEEWRIGRIDPKEVANDLYNQYLATMDLAPESIPQGDAAVLSFEENKDRLGYKIVSLDRNKAYLRDKPYRVLDGGLAAVYYIDYGEGYAITINDAILEQMDVDEETLWSTAIDNTLKIDPPVLRSMEDAHLREDRNLLDNIEAIDPEELEPMYVLTSESGSWGASYMAHPDIMKKAAEVIGQNLYILPSSLHEVILVPDDNVSVERTTINRLHDMVKSANRAVVLPQDILSDEVYRYDVHEHKFSCLTLDVKEEYEAVEDMDF